MELDVRTIQKDELPAWTEAAPRRASSATPARARPTSWPSSSTSTAPSAAFDGDRVVGTLRSFTTDLTVPGGQVSCAALTNVTVTGTHRRRGLLTRMITRDLADSRRPGRGRRRRSIAAEYPIYGRFGYGPAVEAVDLTIEPARALPRLPAARARSS